MSDEEKKSWIYAGGLPYELTEGDIVCVFSQYGEILEISLSRDRETGKSRGFCFIKYEDSRSCELAVDNLNLASVVGRKIKVSHANSTVKTRRLAIVPAQGDNSNLPQIQDDKYGLKRKYCDRSPPTPEDREPRDRKARDPDRKVRGSYRKSRNSSRKDRDREHRHRDREYKHRDREDKHRDREHKHHEREVRSRDRDQDRELRHRKREDRHHESERRHRNSDYRDR